MSELTLLQKAMRIVEEHEPSLFDVYTNKGRDFIHAMSKVVDEYHNAVQLILEDDCLFMDDLTTQIRNLKEGGKPNCKPMDENIKSVTIIDPATGKILYKGGEQ